MTGEEETTGTLMDLGDDAEELREEIPTHDIRIVSTRDGLRLSAERKPGAEGPHSVIGTAGQLREALKGDS